VLAILWLTLRISGVPAWLPDRVEDAIVEWGRLPHA